MATRASVLVLAVAGLGLCGPTPVKCPNAVITLRPDDVKTVGSDEHDEAVCRWLFLPDGCTIGVECSIVTPEGSVDNGVSDEDAIVVENRQLRGMSSCESASVGDFVRVVGGSVDRSFCVNASAGEGRTTAMAMTFNSSSDVVAVSLGKDLAARGILDLIKCKVVCKGDDVIAPATTPAQTEKQPAEGNATASDNPDAPKAVGLRGCSCGGSRAARVVCPPGADCSAAIGSLPWQAALVWRNQRNPWCGGTIISDRYVLTAAHCVKGKDKKRIQVVLGDHDWTTEADVESLRLDLDEMIVHPGFEREAQFDNDFALLRLRRQLNFTHGEAKLRPACLPLDDGGGDPVADPLVGRVGTASGWGVLNPRKPNVQALSLQHVSVSVLPFTSCRGDYVPNVVTPTMLCAASPGADACFGDSGGPFTIRDERDGRAVLEGVISWGKSCASPRWPGVYARVRSALDWIEANTVDSSFCPRDEVARTIWT